MSQTSLGSVLLGGQKKQKLIRASALSVATALLFNVVAPVAIVAAEAGGPATNNNQNVSSSEVAQALQNVSGILESSDQVVARVDGDSAATVSANGTVVDVPKDAAQGVSFGAEAGPKLEIGLPSAEDAGAAKKVAPGVVGYDSGNGSANAVQSIEDGGVRMLTIIDNPNAPTEYDYKVSVPNGGSVQVLDDGSAVVVSDYGDVLTSVSAPWAKDATSKTIKTYFTTDGTTLTQHVQHNVAGVVYPVTADPFWIPAAVIIAGVLKWAVGSCATGAAIGFSESTIRSAITKNNQTKKQMIHDAIWDCAWGIAGGSAGKLLPSALKWSLATKIVSGAKAILRWK